MKSIMFFLLLSSHFSYAGLELPKHCELIQDAGEISKRDKWRESKDCIIKKDGLILLNFYIRTCGLSDLYSGYISSYTNPLKELFEYNPLYGRYLIKDSIDALSSMETLIEHEYVTKSLSFLYDSYESSADSSASYVEVSCDGQLYDYTY